MLIFINIEKIVKDIPNDKYVNKDDIILAARRDKPNFSEKSVYWLLNRLMVMGLLIRVGRDKYRLRKNNKILKTYHYQYSKKMQNVVSILTRKYPLMEFQVWESIQFNYFVNHQIAHNILFVEVENMLENSTYELLRDKFDGNVLLCPNYDTYSLYVADETIVVLNLITETPTDKNNIHNVLLEKLLVDMMINKLISLFVSKSEFAHILEEAFLMYCINESKMFRYARRRNADKRIREFIKKNTNVVLKMEK